MTDLESIPTKELIRQAERTFVEKAIVRLGCFLAIALIVGSWFAISWFVTSAIIPGLFLCFVASIVVPCVVFSIAKFLADFRNRHVLRELDRRFGRWSIPAYVRYYEERREPGTNRCIFKGQTLPHGRRYWGCILLGETGETSLLAAVSRGLYLGVGSDPWFETEHSDAGIAASDAAALRELIETTKGTGTSRFSATVRDGFPAWVAVIFGDGSQATIVSSNLGGLTDEQRRDDRIRLLRLVAKVVCNDDRFFQPDEA